jgi:hypothetical protein
LLSPTIYCYVIRVTIFSEITLRGKFGLYWKHHTAEILIFK